MCNLKVSEVAQTTEVRGQNKGLGQPYTRKKNPNCSGQMIPTKINTSIKTKKSTYIGDMPKDIFWSQKGRSALQPNRGITNNKARV